MINLHFFPSKRIAFYMARLFITRSAAVLVALVAILMMLDLLGNSGKILAHPENGDAELWRYVGLRLPQLIQRFLPFSALLGALMVWMYWTLAHKPGGQPIGALERVFAKVSRRVKKLFRRRRGASEAAPS